MAGTIPNASLEAATGAGDNPHGLRNQQATGPAALRTLEEEREFYEAYAWAVNAFPTLAEGVSFLRTEIGRLREIPHDWRMREVMTNIWLLACGISDAVDDWLLGERYDFSKTQIVPIAALIVKPIEGGLALRSTLRAARQRRLSRWKGDWESAIETYLVKFVQVLAGVEVDAIRATSQLESLLAYPLPTGAVRRRIKLPSAFRSQELTIYDLLSLADKFAAEVQDRSRPILVVGCRTAGSYFAPVLRACFKVRGWESVDSTTIRPKTGTTSRERRKLAAIASNAGLVVITDEPVGTGATMITAIRLLQRAEIPRESIVALLPIHPHNRASCTGPGAPALDSIKIVRLEPEERYKNRAIETKDAQLVLTTYFAHNGECVDSVVEDGRNAWLNGLAETIYHTRLKRLYEVRVRKQDGSLGVRYVLGKSVGFGWLSYHAFLAGARLSRFVTPLIGLRDGILYTEWLPTPTRETTGVEDGLRERLPRAAAQYIAARTRHLKLPTDLAMASPPVDQRALHELASVLSRAHGMRGPGHLQRERLERELQSRPCPVPTLIDGKMHPREWIASGVELRKADFEHHAQGKLELNAADPAYDLADTILTWHLSRVQEEELVRDYAEATGDYDVDDRMFHNKLLAGTWTMAQAIENLVDSRLVERHDEFDQQYAGAFDFLTEHTARYCASLCRRPETLSWKNPLVVLDVDGVIDDQTFGFPSTTAAGILAISLLHAHGYSIAFNSARSLRQLKLYCDYYGAVGVVAEYGGIVWDSIGDRHRALVSDESLRQIERLKDALRQIPGVFLNTDYQYSIRAHVYDGGATAALPETVVGNMMAHLETDCVRLCHTLTGTTLVARETDKGRGLSELLALAGHRNLQTIAIGDSAPDLAMFRIAARSYAPGHIICRSAAQALGCRIASRGYQSGFLQSVRAIVHPNGRRCEICGATEARLKQRSDLFLRLLRIADKPRWSTLLGAILSPGAVTAFRK